MFDWVRNVFAYWQLSFIVNMAWLKTESLVYLVVVNSKINGKPFGPVCYSPRVVECPSR
jgi:hypothetical protein